MGIGKLRYPTFGVWKMTSVRRYRPSILPWGNDILQIQEERLTGYYDSSRNDPVYDGLERRWRDYKKSDEHRYDSFEEKNMAAWDGLPEFIDVANAASKANRRPYVRERVQAEIEKIEVEVRALEHKKAVLIASLAVENKVND